MRRLLTIIIIIAPLLSCSKDEGLGPVLAGTIWGDSVKITEGISFFRNPVAKNKITLHLTTQVIDCNENINQPLQISLEVPSVVGVYNDVMIIVGRYSPQDNQKGVDYFGQTVEISSISNTSTSGKIRLNGGLGSDLASIEGSFTVPICD